MLVNFCVDYGLGSSDNPIYKLEPWSGNRPLPEQKTSPPCKAIDPATTVIPSTQGTFIAQPSCCSWLSCSLGNVPFLNDADLKIHLESHAISVTQNWAGTSKCTWSGCKSKAVFKLLSSLERHLENIHVAPIICVIPSCSFKGPFRNNYELQRHAHQKHSNVKAFWCPFKGCKLSFARKDKWAQHIEEVEHENDLFCPVLHCDKEIRGDFQGFQSRKEISHHIFNEHMKASGEVRAWECHIGGCDIQSSCLKLTVSQMRRHLRRDHGLSQSNLDTLVNFDSAEHHIVWSSQMSSAFSWSVCKLCVPPSLLPSISDQSGQVDRHVTVKATLSPRLARSGTRNRAIFFVCCQCNMPSLLRTSPFCTYCEPAHKSCNDCRLS
ncbi:uncharacterized protein LY89DRAFT_80112 [Mollisia scopiformis]|uniref:C2H2-type domain-containing protein n=1 Tax=Mollisia scopiformis TaxID=149040 RepID=A0A194X844_MOLSC|nr:uncharacterized protein LY89DRAFT_80112 [Mollisia scopiformis]KUJ16333.1 hypothetical protein LY89DRAFT_80112 [Mollisia scopiformis]